MARKPLTVRTLTIMGAASTAGTLAGSTVTELCAHAGFSPSGAGQLATALVTLWTLHKLHVLVDDDRPST